MWTRSCYDPERLAREWKDARWSAMATFVEESVRDRSELGWLLEVRPSDRAALLRAIFDASHALGIEVRRRMGREPTLAEIAHLISRAGTGCFDGRWRTNDAGATRTHCRSYCPFVKGEFDCDYWREAARGLVSGLSESVVFARYESIGHDGQGCVDVLYRRREVDRQFGPIPEEVHDAVRHLLENLNRWEVTLQLAGFNEGTLYFKVVSRHFTVCRSCHDRVESELKRALEPVEPRVQVREVFGEPCSFTPRGRPPAAA